MFELEWSSLYEEMIQYIKEAVSCVLLCHSGNKYIKCVYYVLDLTNFVEFPRGFNAISHKI